MAVRGVAGIIESTHPEVREWAERTDERFRERATPVAVSVGTVDDSLVA